MISGDRGYYRWQQEVVGFMSYYGLILEWMRQEEYNKWYYEYQGSILNGSSRKDTTDSSRFMYYGVMIYIWNNFFIRLSQPTILSDNWIHDQSTSSNEKPETPPIGPDKVIESPKNNPAQEIEDMDPQTVDGGDELETDVVWKSDIMQTTI